MAVNLNAIGKGYALDRMASVLRRRGVDHALLSAGSSSIRALGGRYGGWPVDIRSRLVNRPRLARVRLRDGALGTSGAGEQFVIADGTRYGHVIDPRTGWPAQGVTSATVITADAADADALSTAFLIGGVELAQSYCDAHPGTLALLMVDDGTEQPRVCGQYPGATIE
jgi:FAD:protein FMN transferase